MNNFKGCPNCENIGWYIVADNYTGEAQQEQCQFCYTEEDSIFNVMAKLQSANDELEAENKQQRLNIDNANNEANELSLKCLELEARVNHFKQCYFNAQRLVIRELISESEQDEAMSNLLDELK